MGSNYKVNYYTNSGFSSSVNCFARFYLGEFCHQSLNIVCIHSLMDFDICDLVTPKGLVSSSAVSFSLLVLIFFGYSCHKERLYSPKSA